MKKLLLFLLVCGLGAGGYFYYRRHQEQREADSSSFLTQEKVTIGPRTYDVWSEAVIRERGIPFRAILNKDNAAVLYVEAGNARTPPEDAVKDTLWSVCAGTWDERDTQFARWFDDQKRCLELILEATKKPDCQFPILGDQQGPVLAMQIPQASMMRELTRIIVCEGKRHEHDGDCSKAIACYFAAADLAEHLDRSDSFLICKLVVLACDSIMSQAVELCLANGRADEEDMRAVVRRFTRAMSERPSMGDVLGMERVAIEDTIRYVADHPDQAADVAKAFGDDAGSELARGLAAEARSGPRESLTEVERIWRWSEAWAGQPAWQALQPNTGWRAYIERYPAKSPLVHLMLPHFGRAYEQFAKSEAQLGGVAIFAAIKLYEKKNGRPPASLNELKGDYIPELPKDPFSGRDYVYKVRGNDWILYSVWDNLTDDGGAGLWPHKVSEDKDLIWRNTPIPIEPRRK